MEQREKEKETIQRGRMKRRENPRMAGISNGNRMG